MKHLIAVVAAALCASAAPVSAQVILPPEPLTISWDAPTGSPATLPTAYVFETFRETATGVVITTIEFPAPATSHQVPLSALPEGLFMAALKAKNLGGLSPRSNVIGPFVVAGLPDTPANFRIVPAP